MNSYISHIIGEIFHSTFFILIILTTLLLCVSTSTEEVFSISHSFDRKEILDAIEDWYRYTYPNPSLHPANISEIQQIVGTTLGDIRSVSYISDGKTLNVTLWLSKIKGQQTFSKSFEANPSPHSPVYGVYIDIDSNKKTGRGGIDYDVQVSWNNGKWEKIVQEQSAMGNVKILNNITNYNNFDERRGYITITLDLHLLNNPKRYVMTFYMKDFLENNTVIWDFTNWVNVPPPLYSLSTSPSSITLRPEEEKKVALQIKQIGLPTPIQPFSNFSNKEIPDIGVKFVPNQTTIPVEEASTVMLRINASKNASVDYPYVLPIYANISYPSKNVAKDLKVPTENAFEISNVTITVLPPLTTAEQLQKFVSDYITPINSIWTLLLGVGTAISSIWIYKKRPRDH